VTAPFEIIPEDLLAYASPAEREAYKQALRVHLAKHSPLDFAIATRPESIDFRASRFVSDKIAAMQPGEILVLLMPPRHGKSFIVSESAPAWIHANDPHAGIIHVTYSADFTKNKFGEKNRNLMQRSSQLGIGPRLSGSSKSKEFYSIHPDDGRGFYLATGPGGRVTGEGANWLIIDDLIKNDEEAQSETIRNKTWDFFVDDAMSRLEPGARVILMMTPRHEDDVLHRAIKTGMIDHVVRLPALPDDSLPDPDPLDREPGEPLVPERYDNADLEKIRALSERRWTTQYMLRPRPKDGEMFKLAHFKTWTKLPANGFYFATVDLAHSLKTRADWSVIAVWFASSPPYPKLHLVRLFRDKVPSGEHLEWFDRCMGTIPQAERPRWAGVEDKTFGSTMLSAARRLGRRGKVLLRPLLADTDKVTRAQTAVTLGTQGQLVIPAEDLPWKEEWLSEHLGFDKAAHDDQVDCTAYAAIEFSKAPQNQPAPPPPPPQTPTEKAWAQVAKMRKKHSQKPRPKKLMMS